MAAFLVISISKVLDAAIKASKKVVLMVKLS
jgi:hypothetical protein